MLRGKFIILNTYIKEEEQSQIDNLAFSLRNQGGGAAGCTK